MNYKWIQFQIHGDDRGQLIALEANREIPFQIKRVYYMYDTGEGVRRGYHAHKTLSQVLICIHGNCRLHLDDGFSTEELILSDPSKGVYINNFLWREMYDFSSDAVLMVLASDYYDEKDYIRNYEDFKRFINDKKENINK